MGGTCAPFFMPATPTTPPAVEPQILYEDNHLLVINKPPCIPVQNDQTGDASMIDILKAFIIRRDRKPGDAFVTPAHRIDRPASGVVVFAKTSKAASRLGEQFREGVPDKEYLVWLEPREDLALAGAVPALPDQGQLRDLIVKRPGGSSYITTKAHPEAKDSHLSYQVEKRGDKRVLVRVQLGTGRHHQIRVQFSSRGWSVVGDKRYGTKRALPDKSIALHAHSLHLKHPVSGESMYFEAPTPPSWLTWGPKTGR